MYKFPKRLSLFLLLTLFFIGGCRTLPEEALPPPDPVDDVPLLRPGVRLNVEVFVADTIQTRAENVRISADGEITLPLIGTANVRDLTVRQAETLLNERYREYYVHPEIRIDFVYDDRGAASPWGHVTVLGQVRNPGRVNLPPSGDLTVTHAIQQAGGLAPGARTRSIRVTRRDADDRRETIRVNLRKVGTGRERHEDLRLKANDVVYVPETFF